MNKDEQIKAQIEKLRGHIKPFKDQIDLLLQEQRENELAQMRILFEMHSADIFTQTINDEKFKHVRIINMEDNRLVCEELTINRDRGNFDEECVVFHWSYHPSPAFFHTMNVVMVDRDDVNAKKIHQTMDLLKDIYYTF